MTVYVYVGNTGPTVTGTLLEVKQDGSVGAIDLTSAVVSFQMRSSFGSDLLVDAVADVVGDPLLGKVRYDWVLADTTTAIDSSPGPYRAWWHLDFGGGVISDAPEFDVQFLAHGARRGVGPCSDWCSSQDVRGCYDDVELGSCLTSSVRMASEVLYEMSGRSFPGWCQAVIRPCLDWGGIGGHQVLDRGHIVWSGDAWSDAGGDVCGCGITHSITLPGVAQSVVQVVIDGEVLDPASYRLDPDNSLIRTDGNGWPACQDMSVAGDAAGAFEVTYAHGYSPPEVGRRAAAQLAREFWLACSSRPCKLPSGVTQVVRQGLSITRVANLFAEGATGLGLVDSFLAAYAAPKVLVLSPDTYPTERRTA